MSTSSVTVPASITPACRMSAAAVSSGVWVAGTRCPDGSAPPLCRPPRTTTTGLPAAAVRRASRVNLRGLPSDSRYISTTSVAGSSSQNWRASLPETSARFPAEMKVDSPAPEPSSSSRTAMAMAADWVKIPTRPGGGRYGAGLALSRMSSAVFRTPNAPGPISRIP